MSWHKVKATVISQTGICEAGQQTGDEYIIDHTMPAGMCVWAFYTIFPFVTALQSGGSFPWEKKPFTAKIACPDPQNPVIFELTRL